MGVNLVPFAGLDWVSLGIVASVSLVLGFVFRWFIEKLKAPRPQPRPPIEIKPVYPTRLLVCVLATIGFCVALAVLPDDHADAVVSAYFVLLGNIVASMKDTN